MTVYDYYTMISDTILDDRTKALLSSHDFYTKYQAVIDSYIRINFAQYRLLQSVAVSNNIELSVNDRVFLCVVDNLYKLDGLYETTELEYNPLWNVDGTTTIVTDSRTDDDNTSTESYETTTNGSVQDSTTRNMSDTNDETNNTTLEASSDALNTSEVTDTLYLSSETKDTSTTQASKNDTRTVEDTATSASTNENETKYASSNTDNRDIILKSTVTETRQGNIGVTKTTDLIESQRNIVDYRFLYDLCHMLVLSFAKGVF